MAETASRVPPYVLPADTVRNYLSETVGKPGAANRIEAFRLARQKGWL